MIQRPTALPTSSLKIGLAEARPNRPEDPRRVQRDSRITKLGQAKEVGRSPTPRWCGCASLKKVDP